MALHLDDLGRDVLGRAAQRVRALVLGRACRHRIRTARQSLGEAEVDQLDEASVVEHNVLGLDVTVDDALAVEVSESRAQARGHQPGLRLREQRAVDAEQRLQVPTDGGLDAEVSLVVVGGRAVEAHDVRVVELRDDRLLRRRLRRNRRDRTRGHLECPAEQRAPLRCASSRMMPRPSSTPRTAR